MRRINKFLSLSAAEQRLFMTGLFVLPLVVLSLRLAGYRRTRWLFAGDREECRASANPADDLARASAAARTVRRAAENGPVKANCLPRALLLRRVLQKQGIDCVIRFGVQNERAGLEAHAWVECHGIRIDGEAQPPRQYRPLEAAAEKDAGVSGRADRLAQHRLP